MHAYIKAISYYLPERIIDNSTLNQLFPEWSADKISAKTGIYKRHIARENEFSSDMAVKAADKLFTEYNIDRNLIDFILLCTQSPDYFLPTTACILQTRLNLSTSCGAMDFNLGCSGYVYGLGLAKGLVTAGIAKNVLLLTSETYSKFIHPEDKSNRTIFGDGASATLIGSDNGFVEVLDFDFGTDGRGAPNLMVKNGGMRYRSKKYKGKDITDDFGNVTNDDNLCMNGAEVFNFTSESVPVLVNNILKKNGLKWDEIDLYVFHQANKHMMNHLRKKLKIEESRFFYFLETCGNTVSSTIPIALYEARKQDLIKGNVLLAGFGVGYSWGGCILKVTER